MFDSRNKDAAHHVSQLYCNDLLKSNKIAPCEQSLSKTHQRPKKRGPSFWASHSGQTGLGSARIRLFLTRRRSKSSLQCENQHGVLECDRDLAWVWNCLQATGSAYSIKTWHDFCRVFLSLRVKKGSASRVIKLHTFRRNNFECPFTIFVSPEWQWHWSQARWQQADA